MSALFNLDSYFERINYQGTTTPTIDVLHALSRAHTQSIPFENLDVLLRRPISLELDDIYRKLVIDRRGGYCFEQNNLLLEVLKRLGFTVTPWGARVRLRVTDRNILPVRTHVFLAVEIDGEQWIVDSGVGALSLTQALRLQEGAEQTTPHETRRLQRVGESWFHQVVRDGAWIDVCEFTEQPMPVSDQIVANWYTSSHPDSTFMTQLQVALAQDNGGRITLNNNELKLRQADGAAATYQVADTELLDVLAEYFAIKLPADADISHITRFLRKA